MWRRRAASPPDQLRPEDIRRARFGATTFGEGYDQESVDDYLDQVVHELTLRWRIVDAGPVAATREPAPPLFLTAVSIHAAIGAFPTTRGRQGYRTEDVKALLDNVILTVARLDAIMRGYRFAPPAPGLLGYTPPPTD